MTQNGSTLDAHLRLAAERYHTLLGSAKVNFRYLDVGPESELNHKRLMNLRRTFRANKVDQYRYENHVEVVISPEDLQSVLDQHNLTLGGFRKQSPSEYPELNFSGRQLRCLQGRHRIVAARRFLPPWKRWWIVDFYSHGLILQEDYLKKSMQDADITRKICQMSFVQCRRNTATVKLGLHRARYI